MEMTFPGKGPRVDARLDHSVLLAALAAQRATEEAVKAAQRVPVPPVSDEPLTEILLAGPDWQGALSAQRGSFNRDEAERRQ